MSDTPDFDSMSPEEMMKWMESLAVRQGASEGLTTDADMEIEEVDEADERLEGMGEYKPYGMSDADWEKMQEREAAEKAEKLTAQQAAPPPPPAPEPVPEPVAQVEPEPVAEAEPETADAGAGDMPDFDSMSPEEMMEWMESLAVRQGASEGLTTSASMDIAEVDESDARLEGMGEYKPYAMSDDDWAKMQEREAAEKVAKLAALQEQPTPDAVFEAVEEYEYEDDEEYVEDDEEFFEVAADRAELNVDHFDGMEETQANDPLPAFDDILPAEPVAEVESPMDWLAGLSAAEDESSELEFDMDALADLGALGEAESTGDPMEWLATLSGNEDDAMPDLSALAGDGDEGSLEWMESLASDQGAESEELFTAASLDIPIPDGLNEDGPGYEEFSFEEATGMVQDTDSVPVQSAEMSLEDPESWLDSLASNVSNEIPEDIFSGDNQIIDEEEVDDYEDAEQFDSHVDVVKAQMDSGNLGDNPDDINKFFQSAFSRAAERTDVPDYVDSEDEDDVHIDDVEMPVQAEIPDWLQESMSSVPAESEIEEVLPSIEEQKTATAEMMIADLGLEDVVEEAEIPDWLSGDMSEDTGIIENDIFDEAVLEEATPSLIDTQDTWVDAFSKEDSEEIETWYEGAVAELGSDSGEVIAQSVEADVSLQAADLPVESKLSEGSPQNIPSWMSGDADVHQSVEVVAAQDDNMDWLGETIEEAIDMPDWLQATVDDSITEDEDLPEWLEGETDIEAEDIPDWLRETMDEAEEPVAASLPVDILTEEPAQIVAPTPAPLPVPVQQSPAPVPVSADTVDAVAFLRSAKEKISAKDIDGAILDYEQVIRANKALPQVEKELQRLVEDKSYKKNPAINRVLGDVLMRQGKLQEALNIYRKALNLL